jgi:transposase
MYTKQEIIISSFRDGKSQRKIAKDLKISRKTVSKYLTEYEQSLQGDTGSKTFTPVISSPPLYKGTNRQPSRLTKEVQEEINKLLELNEEKRNNGLRKQMLKKIDILYHLQEKGYSIGYTTVCNYIRTKRDVKKEAFIRQDYQPGSVCEFDWGEVKLYISGKLTVYNLAVFTSAYSNYRFALLFRKQDTLAFQESHVAFFNHIKGVYHQMVYDNMRVAVARFVGEKEKEPTRALVNLKGHYQFHHRFCNIYRGNEKGHVERSVEFIRRKAFSISDSFDTQDQADAHLQEVLIRINNIKQTQTNKTATELFKEEKEKLWNFSNDFSFYNIDRFKVDKYATFAYGTNKYSVPDHLVGNYIDVKITSKALEVYSNNNPIASHIRNYGKHQWVLDLHHYLDTLKKKPGALAGSVALQQCEVFLGGLYLDHFIEDPRGFVELLMYCRQNDIDNGRLQKTTLFLRQMCPTSITADKLIAVLGNKEIGQAASNPAKYGEIEKKALEHLQQIASII